jgi:hypothetical protein
MVKKDGKKSHLWDSEKNIEICGFDLYVWSGKLTFQHLFGDYYKKNSNLGNAKHVLWIENQF